MLDFSLTGFPFISVPLVHRSFPMRDFLQRKERELAADGSCYKAYTVLFIPFALLVFFGLLISGREIIWNIDGLGQYYPFFIYEGEWLRSIVSGLFSGQGLHVPLWEWCSGYGADVPTTFDVFFDPLNLVSAITPPALSEWVFQLLILLRLYLSGLAFTFYGKTRGENKTGIVVGALLYALGGAGLTGVRWSSGLHALMLFPVILAGAERILSGRKPWTFIASLTVLAIVSYYFTYMACILLVGYLTIRVVMLERPHLTFGGFMRWVAIFAGLVILCFLLAGFVLVPSVTALLGMERLVDQSTSVPLLYQPIYYLELFANFLSTSEVGSDMYQGFGGLAFLACLALFSRKGEHRELKIVFVTLSVFLLLPFVGSFFNALNYASNRWSWAYNLCVALILARLTPQLLHPSDRLRRIMLTGCICYGLILLIPYCRIEANVAGFAALLGALVALTFIPTATSARGALVFALAITLGVNGFYYLASDEGGKGIMQTPLGMAYTKLTATSDDSPMLDVPRDSWWRYDEGQLPQSVINRIPNNSLVLGLQGIDFYNSVYNDHVDSFHTELAIAGDDINFRYLNLQGRSDLMALLGVRYYVYRNDGTDCLPYGYPAENVVAQRTIMGLDHQVMEARASLPQGIAFDKALSHHDYLTLTPAQRQQALLQAVVLPGDGDTSHEGGASFTKPEALDFEDKSVPFEVVGSSGATMGDGQIAVSAPGSSVTLAFEGTDEADTYVYFENLSMKNTKPSDFVSEEEKSKMLWHYRANLMLQDVTYLAPTNYEITMRSDVTGLTGFLTNSLPSNHMYGGKDTWLVNLGYADTAAHTVTISFNAAGIYTFDDLQIVTQTHQNYDTMVRERATHTLQDTVQGCNQLTGHIDLDTDSTLLLSVAYSTGWTAYVDGRPAEILVADTGFMGIDLEPGHHDIELRYQTPGLLFGFAVTGCGCIILCILAVILYKNSKKRDPRLS